MSELSGHVEDYLRLRRALGFKLERAGHLLPQLVAYLEAAGVATVTSELAIAWARLPGHTQPNHWAQRLAIARGFARYLRALDPATEVPPPGVFPTRRHRPTPFLWSQRDICRLLEGTRALRPALRAATYEALFGLLATCGMRVGEAVGLDRDDVDLQAGVHHDPPREVRPHQAGSAAPDGHRSLVALRRPSVTASARDPARGRSSSPPRAPGSIAAPWPRPSGRSPPRSGCAPSPSTRGHMTSGTALPWTR